MPNKGKKSKNGTKKKEFKTSLAEFQTTVSDALTTLHLLKSPDKSIILSAIFKLGCYITKYQEEALTFLDQHGLLQNLLGLATNPDLSDTILIHVYFNIIRLTKVKDITPILKEPNIFEGMMNILLVRENEGIRGHITHLMSYMCDQNDNSCLLLKPVLLDYLFQTTFLGRDIELKKNCLELILQAVQCRNAISFIPGLIEFRVLLLNLIMRGPYVQLRPIVLNIFDVISKWNNEQMQRDLYLVGTVPYMIDVLTMENWTPMHNKVLEIIYNCTQHVNMQIENIESKQFMNFLRFATLATSSHALACTVIVEGFAQTAVGRQILFDIGALNLLLQLFRHDCDLLHFKLCDTLFVLSQNYHIAEHLSKDEKLIKQLDRTLDKEYLPWDPYKQATMKVLFAITIITPRQSIWTLFKSGILRHLKDAIEQKMMMDKSVFKMVLELFRMATSSKAIREYLLTENNYAYILGLLKDENEFAKDALTILQQTIDMSKCKIWFYQMDTVIAIVEMLQKTDCSILSDLLVFVEFAVRHQKLALKFLHTGIIPILRRLSENFIRKQLCNHIIKTIYSFELSAKFLDENYLDITDITKSGFCMYNGVNKPTTFPIAEVKKLEKLNSSCTMIIAKLKCKKPSQKPLEKMEVIDETSPLSSEGLQRRQPIDNDVDTYLSIYIKKLKNRFKRQLNVTNKMQMLAQFVSDTMSGFDIDKPPTRHEHEVHIAELKVQFMSNYIPLGHIRFGSMNERAMLYKVLADRFRIPCALVRYKDWVWNEIFIARGSEPPTCYIVDLLLNVGEFIPKTEWNNVIQYNIENDTKEFQICSAYSISSDLSSDSVDYYED